MEPLNVLELASGGVTASFQNIPVSWLIHSSAATSISLLKSLLNNPLEKVSWKTSDSNLS